MTLDVIADIFEHHHDSVLVLNDDVTILFANKACRNVIKKELGQTVFVSGPVSDLFKLSSKEDLFFNADNCMGVMDIDGNSWELTLLERNKHDCMVLFLTFTTERVYFPVFQLFVDEVGTVLDVDCVYTDLYSAEKLRHQTIHDFMDEKDVFRVKELLSIALCENKHMHYVADVDIEGYGKRYFMTCVYPDKATMRLKLVCEDITTLLFSEYTDSLCGKVLFQDSDPSDFFLVSINYEGIILYINKVYPHHNYEDVYGSHMSTYLDADTCLKMNDEINMAIKTGQKRYVKYFFSTEEGFRRKMLSIITPFLDFQDLTLMTLDITDCDDVDGRLRNNFMNLDYAVGLFSVNEDLMVTFWNHGMQEFTGLSENRVKHRAVDCFLPQESVSALRRVISDSCKDSFEICYIDCNKQKKHLLLTASYMESDVLFTGHDISEKKEIETQKDQERTMLTAMLNKGPMAIYLSDYHTQKFILVNQAAADVIGYTKSELIGLSIRDIICSKDRPSEEDFKRHVQSIKRSSPKVVKFDRVLKHKHKDFVVVELVASYMKIGLNEYLFTYCLDKRNEIILEDKIKASEKELEMITSHTEDVITKHDHCGKFLYISPKSRHLFGFDAENYVNKDPFEFIHVDDVEKCRVMLAHLILNQDTLVTETVRYRHKKGHYIACEVKAKSYVTDRRDIEIICCTRDIRDRLQRQEAEKTVQRHEVMLREVHHRVKNDLQVVSALLGLQSTSVSSPQVRELIRQCQTHIHAISLVHESLYQESKHDVVLIGQYIHHLIRHMMSAFGLSKDKVQLVIEVPDHLFFDIDLSQYLGLIVSELFTNIVKHVLTVKDVCQVNIGLTPHASGYRLIVKDDGPGFVKSGEKSARNGFGKELVSLLVKQLNGKVDWCCTDGSEVIVDFDVV